jgi:hypothetical protein
MPLVPFNLFSYALGLTRIPLVPYVLASLVCMAPGAVAYTWLGHAGREAAAGNVAAIRYGLFALGLLAAIALLPARSRRCSAPRATRSSSQAAAARQQPRAQRGGLGAAGQGQPHRCQCRRASGNPRALPLPGSAGLQREHRSGQGRSRRCGPRSASGVGNIDAKARLLSSKAWALALDSPYQTLGLAIVADGAARPRRSSAPAPIPRRCARPRRGRSDRPG